MAHPFTALKLNRHWPIVFKKLNKNDIKFICTFGILSDSIDECAGLGQAARAAWDSAFAFVTTLQTILSNDSCLLLLRPPRFGVAVSFVEGGRCMPP